MLVEIHTNTRSATKKIYKLTNANDTKFKCIEVVENCIRKKQNINPLIIEPEFTKWWLWKMMSMESFDDSQRIDDEIDNKPMK